MKYVKKIIFIITLSLIFINKTYAKTIEIDEITEEFPNTKLISELKELGSDIIIENDKNNKQLKIIIDNKVYTTFNYNNEYIEFDNRNTQINTETIDNNYLEMIVAKSITMAMINISGYENKFINTDRIKELENGYDAYGLQIITEKYNNSTTNGGNTGEFIRYFKINLNNEKISNLIDNYGIEINNNQKIINENTPILSTEEITDKYIKLYVKVDISQEENLTCIIYKSTSLNGDNESLFKVGQKCEKGVIITDNNINQGDTYYYKAIILGNKTNNFSNPVAITIPKKELTSQTKETVKKNPRTNDLPVSIIILITIASLLSVIIIKNKV